MAESLASAMPAKKPVGRALRMELERKKSDGMGDMMVASDEENEKQIIKEGLSEYFIFTIEGTETIPNGWSKRMRSFEGTDCRMKIQYRYRPNEYGDQLVRLYLLTNDK